jgi:hypothetical protein
MPSEQALKRLYLFATERLRAGDSAAVIQKKLVAHGLDAEEAERVTNDVVYEHSPEGEASTGKTEALIGAILCIGGAVFTFGSLENADTEGSWILFYGP